MIPSVHVLVFVLVYSIVCYMIVTAFVVTDLRNQLENGEAISFYQITTWSALA